MQNTWLVIVPPLLVILFAHYTRSIIAALLVGIFSASLIIHNFAILKSCSTSVSKIFAILNVESINSWESFWDSNYVLLCLFLLVLGMIIALLQRSGGVSAYGNFVKRYLKRAWHAEAATMLLSIFLFVDDYFSCLTTGSVMRNVTDRFKIPRVKLSLLVTSAAAPLAVLFPLSSWVAEIVGQMQRSGVSAVNTAGTIIKSDPFHVYLGLIPFFFYAWLIIIFLWVMIVRRSSYGILRKHEIIAAETDNLYGGKEPAKKRFNDLSEDNPDASHSLVDFVVPMLILFTSVLMSMLYFGSFNLFGGINSFMQALQKTRMTASLFMGSLTTLVCSSLFLFTRRKINPKLLPSTLLQGIKLMGPSVTMLILIWTLTALLHRELATGHYIASFLGNSINVHFLPIIFFLISSATGTFMGNGWGAMDILISIALPMTVEMLQLPLPVLMSEASIIYPIMGAIVSGAVVSHHISPISDCMLMSSISSGAHHMDTVKVQSQFSMPLIISASCAFLISGLLINLTTLSTNGMISLGVGIITQIIVLKVLGKKRA